VLLGEGFFERKRQKCTPRKKRYFAAIGSPSIKTVADRNRHAICHN